MIKEKIEKSYHLNCDKCGTGYCNASGIWFSEVEGLAREALNSGWVCKSDRRWYCPDCK